MGFSDVMPKIFKSSNRFLAAPRLYTAVPGGLCKKRKDKHIGKKAAVVMMDSRLLTRIYAFLITIQAIYSLRAR